MRFEEKIGIARSINKNHQGIEETYLKVKFPDEQVCEVTILESMQKENWERILEENLGKLRVRCIKVSNDYGYPQFLLLGIIS
jgi:hypothetical protein